MENLLTSSVLHLRNNKSRDLGLMVDALSRGQQCAPLQLIKANPVPGCIVRPWPGG